MPSRLRRAPAAVAAHPEATSLDTAMGECWGHGDVRPGSFKVAVLLSPKALIERAARDRKSEGPFQVIVRPCRREPK